MTKRYTYEIRYVGAPHASGAYHQVSAHNSIDELDAAWKAGCYGNMAYDYAAIVSDGTNEWPMWSDECPNEAFE